MKSCRKPFIINGENTGSHHGPGKSESGVAAVRRCELAAMAINGPSDQWILYSIESAKEMSPLWQCWEWNKLQDPGELLG